jgi:oxalate decarboxylase/phosphoglucose isomerase-like protein (cupin superfamily)
MGPVMPASNGTSSVKSTIRKPVATAPLHSRRIHCLGNSFLFHIHPTQDEFILVQEGVLDLKLDGVWVQAKAGDLVRMPRRIPHGYFNKSDKPARALFWVSPAGKLEALFEKADGLGDPVEVVTLSAQHDVHFLPPEAND